jgi:hypothetical protein
MTPKPPAPPDPTHPNPIQTKEKKCRKKGSLPKHATARCECAAVTERRFMEHLPEASGNGDSLHMVRNFCIVLFTAATFSKNHH